VAIPVQRGREGRPKGVGGRAQPAGGWKQDPDEWPALPGQEESKPDQRNGFGGHGNNNKETGNGRDEEQSAGGANGWDPEPAQVSEAGASGWQADNTQPKDAVCPSSQVLCYIANFLALEFPIQRFLSFIWPLVFLTASVVCTACTCL
jgi:hypothetical protein